MSQALTSHLLNRFPYPEYMLLTEVHDKAGFSARRRADAIAMGLWPSRGLHIHGFECKISRSDWLSEKKDPQKAEEGLRACDFIWLVVSDREIVKDGELPTGWGLLVPRGKTLVTVQEPTKREPSIGNLERHFMAAMFRRAGDGHMVPKAEVDRLVRERVAEHEKIVEDRHAGVVKRTNDFLQQLHGRVEAFERAAGQSLEHLMGIAPALGFLQANGLETFLERLVTLEDGATSLLHGIQTAREKAKELVFPCTCGHEVAEHPWAHGWPRHRKCRQCPCGQYQPKWTEGETT